MSTRTTRKGEVVAPRCRLGGRGAGRGQAHKMSDETAKMTGPSMLGPLEGGKESTGS